MGPEIVERRGPVEALQLVLADGAIVGRILKVHAAPVGSPWMWTLACYRAQFARPVSFISSYGNRNEEALAELRASFFKETGGVTCHG